MHEMKRKEDYVVSMRVVDNVLSSLRVCSALFCVFAAAAAPDEVPATPTTRNRCNQSSARSMVSENTVDTERSISMDSSPKVRSLIEVSWTRSGAPCGPSAGELAGEAVEDVLNVAHLPGSARINLRTLAFACSGKPVPAYLLTTSTTLRRVSMISFLIAVRVEFAVEGVATAFDWLDPTASDTRKLRSSCICCSICLVAY